MSDATASTEPRRSSDRVLDYASIALVIVVGVAIPLLVASHHGALNIPRSDDWSYLRTLFRWSEEGRWDFNGWVSMTLVGQVVTTRPVVAIFGSSIAAVRISTAVLGGLGLCTVIAIARSFDIPTRRASLIAICIAATPLWGSLANTYMTDVPAFAAQAFTLYFAVRALRRTVISLPLLGVSVALGVWAISIRQYAGVTLIAILIIATLSAHRSKNRNEIRNIWIINALAFAATAAVLAIAGAIPHPQSLSPTVPNASSIQVAFESAGGFARIAGLFMIPVVISCGPLRMLRRARLIDAQLTKLVLIVGAALLALSYFFKPRIPFVGNYFARQGVLADDIVRGTRPNVMPAWMFDSFAVLGSIGALALLVAAVPMLHERLPQFRQRKIDNFDPCGAVLALSLIGFFTAYELAIMVNFPIFDRYVLPALPIIGILYARAAGMAPASTPALATAQPIRATAGVTISMVVLIALGFVYTDESASYDGARWQTAVAATQQGFAVADIDAGYEWVGFRLDRSPPFRLIGKPEAYRKSIKTKYLKGLCVTVVVTDRGRPATAVAERVSTGLLRDPVTLYAKRLPDTACATQSLNVDTKTLRP